MNQVSRRSFLSQSTIVGAATVGAACTMSTGAASPASAAEEASKLPGKTPHSRFAVNLEMWWRKLPFLDRIREAAKLGFPAIEFWPWEGKDLPAIAALTQELSIDIAQFTAWGFNPGMNNPKNHPAVIAAITKGCEVAKQLHCKKMTVVGGDDQPGMTQPEMHANIITALKQVAPIAEQNDVMLILEPMNIRVDHKGHSLYGSEPTMRICREVNSSHVKINWDLYHMQITEGDLCGHLREGMREKLIGYLQLADHPGRNEPGTGEVAYTRVLKEAYDLGYRDAIGLELNPKTTELAAAQACFAADQW